MKRSEMVELMYSEYVSGIGSQREILDKILKAMEDAGMLPPKNPKITKYQETKDIDILNKNITIGESWKLTGVSEWEPEE